MHLIVSAESSRSACISSPLAPNRQINVFPGDSVGKESTCNAGDVEKIPRRNEMAIHSSILAWKIPWTEDLGRLQSVGLQESDTT